MSQGTRLFELSYDGITFFGTYHYTTGEKATMNHPGSATEVFINDIQVQGSEDNLIDVLKDAVIEALEQQIADYLDEDRYYS